MSSIESILGSPKLFLKDVMDELKALQMDCSTYIIDHICYRVSEQSRYQYLKTDLSRVGELLAESLVGGRPIATFKLYQPIVFERFAIDCLELPSPKKDSFYEEGYEHLEMVIHQSFQEFMNLYPHLRFDTSGMHKSINPDLRLGLKSGKSLKFHHQSLEKVIEIERKGV